MLINQVQINYINSLTFANPKDLKKYSVPNKLKNIDWHDLISDPAKNTSESTIDELLEISRLTLNRNNSDESLIKIVDSNPSELFKPILNKYNKKFPYKLFNNIYNDVYDMVMIIKNYYNRPRPYQLAKIYNIPINLITTKTHHTPSYPSGHTVYSSLVYHLLTYLYNDIPQQELIIPVNQTGHARMLQGIHYKSDITAALDFTHNLFSQYLINKLGDYQ